MSHYRDLVCDKETRRWQNISNGIDYIEVSAESLDAQRRLHIHFLKDPSAKLVEELVDHPEKFCIKGGVRVQNIEVLSVEKEDEHLVVETDQAGDFSIYTLVIDSQELDRAYSQCDFSFKAGCPSRFDCKTQQVCPTEPRVEMPIDYMAKDYASFRQALIDLIPTLVPDWTERHEADLGITLLELLAYVGDRLSYYQDAVANEAYLNTARQRVSVRRHARLIDYRMHDGVSARAFVHFNVRRPSNIIPKEPQIVLKGTQILSRIDVPLGAETSTPEPVILAAQRKEALSAADVVFETIEDVTLDASLNQIRIHTWGNQNCCLSRGATTVDLVGDDLTGHLRLHKGDFLLFEEVRGIKTGQEEDADPAHRQVVRLTEDPLQIEDPISNQPITRIKWGLADALKYPFCISTVLGDCSVVDDVSVARGNLVLADHGHQVVDEQHKGPKTPANSRQWRAHRFRLKEGPLGFCIKPKADDSVSDLFNSDPQKAEPQVLDLKISGTSGWKQTMPDLMNSDPFDPHFTVETDNEGLALIRFGDGKCGMRPPYESDIQVTYRVGVGRSGNVGSESLVHIIEPEKIPVTKPDDIYTLPEISIIRNPLPSWGGTDPELIEKVKHLAPAAFHAEQLRAVTEDDYARVAEKHPLVSKAIATFRWTGSWHTVFISIDPLGQAKVTPDLKENVQDWVAGYVQVGYDLVISPPKYVPLNIEMDVCVSPSHFRSDVEATLLAELSNQSLLNGTRGFFHPDNFTFNQPLYLSQLYAAVEKVEGVDSAVITKFQRFAKTSKNELDRGYISADRLEIFRLDNDPNFPENGHLILNMRGGK